MQPLVGNMNLQIFVGPPGAVPPSVQANPPAAVAGFRFGNATNDQFVQISGSSFVYQMVGGDYPGWPNLKERLLGHWAKVRAEVTPDKVIKIGLRYVNRIAKEANHTQIRDWLQASKDIPASLISSEGHFFARIETSPAIGHLKVVTVGSQDPSDEVRHGAVILDIDRICQEGDIPLDGVSEKLELLHEDLWVAFDSVKTALLDSRLKGE